MSCPRPFLGAHRCRVGGGHAYYSDDGARTWFCREHAPSEYIAAKVERLPELVDEEVVL